MSDKKRSFLSWISPMAKKPKTIQKTHDRSPEPVGVVFAAIGMQQVCVVSTNTEQVFNIEGKNLLAKFDSQSNMKKSLNLTLQDKTDNKKTAIHDVKQEIEKELSTRKAHVQSLQHDIDEEMKNIEEHAVDGEKMAVDDIKADLSSKFTELLAEKTNHQRRINELEKMTKITVNYSIKNGPTAMLLPGLVTKVSFLQSPLIWCPFSLANEEEGQEEGSSIEVQINKYGKNEKTFNQGDEQKFKVFEETKYTEQDEDIDEDEPQGGYEEGGGGYEEGAEGEDGEVSIYDDQDQLGTQVHYTFAI